MDLSIIDLPPELLEEICSPKYLPKANDRRRLAQVCKVFYKIVRRQSEKFGTLYIDKTAPDKSPAQVFKDSTTFPFSNLHVEHDAPDIILDQDFWLEHGQYITELTINKHFTIHWLTLFPFLKKLKLDRLSRLQIEENAPKIPLQLPVEEFCIVGNDEVMIDMGEICYILECCPSLKSIELFMGQDHFKRFAELLPWIESIDTVKVAVQKDVELMEIMELPTKVVLKHLRISSNTNVESIVSFFNTPRHIETLSLGAYPYDNELRFTKDKVLPLLKAESINKLVVNNIPEFAGSLDFLAQVPGLQELKISLGKKMVFLPRFWSNPNTTSKIHETKFWSWLHPEVLSGLNSLSYLSIGISKGNLEVVRNHPKLKRLVILYFYCGDAELEPISSLHDLEILELNKASKVTSDAFKSIIKFPKLKKLVVSSGEMKNDIAMLLPVNCPNLEELELDYALFNVDLRSEGISSDDLKDSLNDAGFEHLIRSLPYLKKFHLYGNHHLVSQEKIEQMQMEFNYLKIDVKNSKKTSTKIRY